MNITATLIIQMVAFAIFIFLVNKILWKPLSGIMSDRQKRIEDGLISAERGQLEKKEAEEKATQILDQSKLQATEIVTNAQKQAELIISTAKESAVLEADKIKDDARDEISQALSQAKAELQSQVGALVMLGVAKIVKKEVNQAIHQQTLAELSSSL